MENERNCNCTQWPEAVRDIFLFLAIAAVAIVFFLV